jgi:hypothetical protein
MFTVRIEGVEELKRSLSDIGQKQLPYATALAITRTAKSVEQRLLADMSSAFKPASPYVAHSTFSTAATKQNLTATIGLKDIKPAGGTAPSVLLKENFSGGLRGNKPFEKAIASLGGLPSGWRAIPGSGIKLDAYGNPSRSEIGEMLGALRSHLQIYKGRGKRLTLTGYFIVPVGAPTHLHPGIYKRLDRAAIKSMFIFVQSARYRKVIDFERNAAEVIAREFQPTFDAAFRDAIRSAR